MDFCDALLSVRRALCPECDMQECACMQALPRSVPMAAMAFLAPGHPAAEHPLIRDAARRLMAPALHLHLPRPCEYSPAQPAVDCAAPKEEFGLAPVACRHFGRAAWLCLSEWMMGRIKVSLCCAQRLTSKRFVKSSSCVCVCGVSQGRSRRPSTAGRL